MSYGPPAVFNFATASGASTSSYIDLGNRSISRLAVHYTTMSTGAEVTVYGCDTATGTFLPVLVREVVSSAATYDNLTIATGVSGGWGMIEAPPLRYLQFITSAVVSGGVSYTVVANG